MLIRSKRKCVHANIVRYDLCLNWHAKKHKECYLELSLFPSISRSKASSSLDDIPPASLSLQSSKTSKPSPREKLTSAIAVEFKQRVRIILFYSLVQKKEEKPL